MFCFNSNHSAFLVASSLAFLDRSFSRSMMASPLLFLPLPPSLPASLAAAGAAAAGAAAPWAPLVVGLSSSSSCLHRHQVDASTEDPMVLCMQCWTVLSVELQQVELDQAAHTSYKCCSHSHGGNCGSGGFVLFGSWLCHPSQHSKL